MLSQAWKTMKQCLGHVHPRLATILVDMAAVKSQQGRSTEAQQLLVRSIAMWRHMGGGSQPALVTALANLADLCKAHGKEEEEQRLHHEILCIKRLNSTANGSEAHLRACAHLSSVQVLLLLLRLLLLPLLMLPIVVMIHTLRLSGLAALCMK